ncbi:MAG: ROK family transcriptional regulator [Clostridia bacterium]|nr:ROK family transcriptional regulator [Clostridia bacterium]
MAKGNGQNLMHVKYNNVNAIKWILFRNETISRARIAEMLDLTPATVTNIVSELMNQGVVREENEFRDPSRRSGRKPIDIRLNAEAFHVIGLAYAMEGMQVCLADLRGRIVARETEEKIPQDYRGALELLRSMAERMRSRSGDIPVLGIGLSLPGLVSSREGKYIHWKIGPEDWFDKPLAEDLARLTGLPVRMDNAGRARAKRVALFAPDLVEGSETFLVCYAREGIACHMQLMSRILYGEGNAAGEIGNMVMVPESEENPDGKTLNDLAGLGTIRRQLREGMNHPEEPSLLQTLCKENGEIPVSLILMAQEAGDPLVCRVMNRAMGIIGTALANIVNFVNPHYIVLTGPWFRTAENVETVRRTMMRHVYSADQADIRVVYQDAGEYAAALSGAALAVHRFFLNEPVITGSRA